MKSCILNAYTRSFNPLSVLKQFTNKYDALTAKYTTFTLILLIAATDWLINITC